MTAPKKGWVVAKNNLKNEPFFEWFDKIIKNEEGEMIIFIGPNKGAISKAHAIAAAPELLAACEKAREFLINLCTTNKNTLLLIGNISEAIAKAKGEL